MQPVHAPFGHTQPVEYSQLLPPPSPPPATTQLPSFQVSHSRPLGQQQPPPPFPSPHPHLAKPSTKSTHANLHHQNGPPPTEDHTHKTCGMYHIPHSPQHTTCPCLTCGDVPPPSKCKTPQQTGPKTPTASHSPHILHPVLLWCHLTSSTGMRPLLGCFHIWPTIPMLTLELLETFSMEDATRAVTFQEGGDVTGRSE